MRLPLIRSTGQPCLSRNCIITPPSEASAANSDGVSLATASKVATNKFDRLAPTVDSCLSQPTIEQAQPDGARLRRKGRMLHTAHRTPTLQESCRKISGRLAGEFLVQLVTLWATGASYDQIITPRIQTLLHQRRAHTLTPVIFMHQDVFENRVEIGSLKDGHVRGAAWRHHVVLGVPSLYDVSLNPAKMEGRVVSP